MEVMEDGNLMDKIHILIQRDMEYYKDKQSILQETICPGIIGGKLDFPRSASFASMKLVLWWEEEYVAAHKKSSGFLQNIQDNIDHDSDVASLESGGIVKDSDPSKFLNLVSKSADKMLDHLHMLTQEALDHADLTVLTGTIGAAALLKNCLWFYVQSINDMKNYEVDELQMAFKKYHEMCEALAERLLDLHCRLLSLYILQDAESLDWDNPKCFFESERGSYVIQMWWLYMQDHLHMLTQEALDHADLTVLTGTIGAAALLKNCLWFYVQSINDMKNYEVDELQMAFKKYHEMCEALAERLLDLHCRLLSLYILQDAESLDWDNPKCFFESERGSYVIQMWWLYMQGTKEDLWNTVPPKMAQRVFSGMLNESLTILTVRYTQSLPSEARSQLLVVDISNLLLCVAQLLPCICDSSKDLIGFAYNTSSKIMRDIHTKCQELLVCLILRGSSLDDLHKFLKKGLECIEIFKPKSLGPAPWITFALPNIFKDQVKANSRLSELNPDSAIALELMVLLAQPQPNWSLLLKVICMNKCRILHIILLTISTMCREDIQKVDQEPSDCGGFLCYGDGFCRSPYTHAVTLQSSHYYDLVLAATEIILHVASNEDLCDILIPVITRNHYWDKCFERKHVWNQICPPWFKAMVNFVEPLLKITSDTVINAVQTGATIYQAMSLILVCFSQFWEYVNPALPRIAHLLQEIIPTDTIPINHSCLLQILISALYTHLLKNGLKKVKKEVTFDNTSKQALSRSESSTSNCKEAISFTIAEALCGIDEDNKHTDQIEDFLQQVKSCTISEIPCVSNRMQSNQQMVEMLVSDIMLSSTGRYSLKTLYHFLKNNSEWINQQLGVSDGKTTATPNRTTPQTEDLVHSMFHVGYQPFDQIMTGVWKPNWPNLLQIPMGLNPEKVWCQLSSRWEFKNSNSSNLSTYDISIINYITSLFKL